MITMSVLYILFYDLTCVQVKKLMFVLFLYVCQIYSWPFYQTRDVSGASRQNSQSMDLDTIKVSCGTIAHISAVI